MKTMTLDEVKKLPPLTAEEVAARRGLTVEEVIG